MERATKVLVVASALGAVAFETFHAGRERPFLPPLALITAAICYGIARKYPESTAGTVLAAGYLASVTVLVTIGFRYWHLSLWMAAFLGAMAPTMPSHWQFPARLRFPLIAWALAVAVTWPLVALRVLDWTPSILWTRPPTRNILVHAVPAAVWVTHTALVTLLGLLWIDWLFGRFGRDQLNRFERVIVVPALVGVTLAALLSVYQGFFDLRFLSVGGWADIGRASGALIDANASGALSALWVGVALCYGVRARTGITTLLLVLSAVLLLVATWMTGSRTAMLCALVGLIGLGPLAISRSTNRWKLLLTVSVAMVLLTAAWISLAPSVSGPMRRVSEVLPSLSRANVENAARQLWNRQGYGTAAIAMIADEPVQGVGVGFFHLLATDYLFEITKVSVPSDNAQNWFRHQFAELGLLGSVGWLWWNAFLVAALMAATRIVGERRAIAAAVTFAIVGFGLASLLGMPSQNMFVALTFSTFAFWLLLMVEGSREPSHASERSGALPAALLLALVFAGATAYAGWYQLRPPFLAKRFNYLYEYGVYESMGGPTGRTQTTARAVSVMSAPTSQLKLTVWVEHPDADDRPVRVEVWVDRERIIQGRFPRNVPLTRVVQVPGNDGRFVLETRVDRVFSSPATKQSEVGLSMAWEFETPPANIP